MQVPGPVRALARVRGQQAWLDGLPGLLAELAADWGVTIGEPYPGATEAYVAPVGPDAVLKVLVPGHAAGGGGGGKADREATVLRLAAGVGCVRLLRADPRRQALLLERLGPPLSELGLPITRRHEVLCAAARALWRPAPDAGLPTGADRARSLVTEIQQRWADLDRPCTEAAVAQALAAARRRARAHDGARAVLVHGDVHQWNTLRTGDGSGFRLVDPDGMLAEPEADLGVLMREDLPELMAGDPRDRAAWLAARTGTDAAAIWDWGVLERMTNGLRCLTGGLEPVGRLSLAAADRIAAG